MRKRGPYVNKDIKLALSYCKIALDLHFAKHLKIIWQ